MLLIHLVDVSNGTLMWAFIGCGHCGATESEPSDMLAKRNFFCGGFVGSPQTTPLSNIVGRG